MEEPQNPEDEFYDPDAEAVDDDEEAEDDEEGVPTVMVLAESENYSVLVGEDIDGEEVYIIELGIVTLHLFREEWEEFASLIQAAAAGAEE